MQNATNGLEFRRNLLILSYLTCNQICAFCYDLTVTHYHSNMCSTTNTTNKRKLLQLRGCSTFNPVIADPVKALHFAILV